MQPMQLRRGLTLVLLVVSGITAWLTLQQHASDPEPAPARSLAVPPSVGGFERLRGAEIESLRAGALEQMADGTGVSDRFVEYYGEAGTPRLVLQAATGTFHPGTNLFDNEQRSLAAGGATLAGAVDRDVNGVTMRCDTGTFGETTIGMCVHAVPGLLVIGTGLGLDAESVASLVAEAAPQL